MFLQLNPIALIYIMCSYNLYIFLLSSTFVFKHLHIMPAIPFVEPTLGVPEFPKFTSLVVEVVVNLGVPQFHDLLVWW